MDAFSKAALKIEAQVNPGGQFPGVGQVARKVLCCNVSTTTPRVARDWRRWSRGRRRRDRSSSVSRKEHWDRPKIPSRRSGGHPTTFGILLEFVLANGVPGRFAFSVGARAGGAYVVEKEQCSVGEARYEVIGGALRIPPGPVWNVRPMAGRATAPATSWPPSRRATWTAQSYMRVVGKAQSPAGQNGHTEINVKRQPRCSASRAARRNYAHQ